MQPFGEYLDFLQSIGRTLEQLTALAKEKNAAAAAGDLGRLDGCIEREQALGLALRGMEQKRAAMREALGLFDVSLSGLVSCCPAPEQARARAVCEQLRSQYAIYVSAQDAARTTLECNLHQIERQLLDLQQSARGDASSEGGRADIRA